MSEMVAVLMLDVERVADSFHESALSNAVIYPETFMQDALFYMANGMYSVHFVEVPEYDGQVDRLDSAYAAQQHHEGHTAQFQFRRSMCPGDAAILKDRTVWVLTGKGWRQIGE